MPGGPGPRARSVFGAPRRAFARLSSYAAVSALLGAVTLTGLAPAPVQLSIPAAAEFDAQLAGELCPVNTTPGIQSAINSITCLLPRVLYAQGQGAHLRTKALAAGATCEPHLVAGAPILWVCFGFNSPLVARGGTTYGDTFFAATPRERFLGQANLDRLLAHEAEHIRQWRLLGRRFPQLYFEAGANPCTNIFERAAGLAAGGYDCPAVP